MADSSDEFESDLSCESIVVAENKLEKTCGY